MTPVPTNPLTYYAFDALVRAAMAARWWLEETLRLSRIAEPTYFVTLAIGAQPASISAAPR
jgi:predicted nucleic acid-binding protein